MRVQDPASVVLYIMYHILNFQHFQNEPEPRAHYLTPSRRNG